MSNYGAVSRSDIFYPTKKALREAVKLNPEDVVFFDTSAFANNGTVTIDQLKPSDVIVGPDPYGRRSWYANVKNGRII